MLPRLGRIYAGVLKSKSRAILYYKDALTLAQTLVVPYNTPWLKVRLVRELLYVATEQI